MSFEQLHCFELGNSDVVGDFDESYSKVLSDEVTEIEKRPGKTGLDNSGERDSR